VSDRLSKRERVLAALSGAEVDRAPVAAWGHLIPAEIRADTLAEASLAFLREYDWDWLKVNTRASIFAEAWGSEFDFSDYRGVLPRFVRNRFDPLDFGYLEPVKTSTGVWAEHLAALRTIKKGIGGVPFVQTIFSPASVLAYLAGRPKDHLQESASRNHAETLLRLVRTEPDKVHHALGAIAESLAALAAASVEAGADGVFFAITKLARRGGLTLPEFEAFGKPYDLKVLAAVRGAPFNLLHTCGSEIYWDQVQDYPVQAINWASTLSGNPSIKEARVRSGFALIGGVDEIGILMDAEPKAVREAARAALAEGGKRKFLLAPGCCIEPATPRANIRAFRDSVE
jgi:uroporphyrinogen decarboxylase